MNSSKNRSQPKRKYNSAYRQSKAAETRQKVMTAADSLFRNSGYENVTIADIAKTAGVASQTVYFIFKSKHGLLLQLLDKSSEAAGNMEFAPFIEEVAAPGRLAGSAAKIFIKKNTCLRILLNSYGGTHILQPDLVKSFTKTGRQRRKAFETYLSGIAGHSGAKRARSAAENGKRLDLLTAISDAGLYYYLVEQAGWTEDEVENALRQLFVFVAKSMRFEKAGAAPVAPDALKGFIFAPSQKRR